MKITLVLTAFVAIAAAQFGSKGSGGAKGSAKGTTAPKASGSAAGGNLMEWYISPFLEYAGISAI
jgi:hypothetical protein